MRRSFLALAIACGGVSSSTALISPLSGRGRSVVSMTVTPPKGLPAAVPKREEIDAYVANVRKDVDAKAAARLVGAISPAAMAAAMDPPTTTDTVPSIVKELEAAAATKPTRLRKRDRLIPFRRARLAREAEKAAEDLIGEACEIVDSEDNLIPEEEQICADETRMRRAVRSLGGLIFRTVDAKQIVEDGDEEKTLGEVLEEGWEKRGSGSSLRRNVEVWRFGAAAALKVVKANKILDPEEKKVASTAAAEFIRDSLVRLGPTFVKLGQVISTRTDVISPAYIDVLKTLQDDVPGFSGARAKEIVARELGVSSVEELFTDFSESPLAAASLGQVHTAFLNGSKVAVKVQRAGLKELFDVDLKNLKKLAELLDKFDPKSDGADRDWVSIYDESARLLYLEIDYLNEARNTMRFAEDFKKTPWVITPDVYFDLTTPRVLTMQFVETLKLTDIEQVEKLGLDRKMLAKRTAESFLSQILRTGYFHCDPHPGNLAVDKNGNLVYYDYGMMDELKVR
mmetsp:Transcript_37656/g.102224  ORF Transcript_37656/g.102224 Transcript_37656/m.102224 type:complete len:512 (+) Transcript_37656:833-2368(+)